jgi:uncharacterized protein YjbI with pentapeptide repeats
MKSAKSICFVIICFLCYVVCSFSPVLAEDTTTVPLKEWKDYTAEEKGILRNRWTNEKVEEIVRALKEEEAMPEFWSKLPHQLDDSTSWDYDQRGIPLKNRNLPKADLSWANLQGANLLHTNLQGAHLGDANLQGANLLHTNLQGADLWDANLQGANLGGANLQGADLLSANLQGANLRFARLDSANLVSAELQGARILGAKLQGAGLFNANLQGADLTEARLDSADLKGAKLQRANLEMAKLQDADLFGATFDSTYLFRVNLGEAKNIRYIVWGDRIENRYIIGEEKDAESTKSDEDFRRAEITYRDLKAFYKKELMDDVAGEFHYRENKVITKR